MSLVLAHCLGRGARAAEPGEFTLRAFLSGRIDLTRAEAVLGVIDAANPAQLDAALQQLAGGLSGPILALRDHLLDVVAQLEANLDFTEEPDVDPLGRAALADELERSAAELDTARPAADRPRPARGLSPRRPGRPAQRREEPAVQRPPGRRDRAIVSPQAGTTRDYLTALCDCDGLTVELVDTAGIESAGDAISTQAQALRGQQAARADLLLDCRSADTADPSGRRTRGRSSVSSWSGPSAISGSPDSWRRRRFDGIDRDERGHRGRSRGAAVRHRTSAFAAEETEGNLPPGPPRDAGAASSAPRRRCGRPRSPSSSAAATSWSPSTCGWPSRSSARSSAPWSPTTSSTASSAASASGNDSMDRSTSRPQGTADASCTARRYPVWSSRHPRPKTLYLS